MATEYYDITIIEILAWHGKYRGCYVYSLRVESAPALMSHGWCGWNTISSTPVDEWGTDAIRVCTSTN